MTEDANLSLSAGTEIAGYRIEAPLGRGGMAVVFKARDTRLDRPVALKILAPELARSRQFRERFLRESRLAASLEHPNIIPVYEAAETSGLLFIAMRLVPGGDLTDVLESRGPLDPAETVMILSQVAAALDAAHAAGLVHRDVKPDNILIVPSSPGNERPHVYLSDFGLTKRMTSLSGVTSQGQFVATMDYAAPEQISSRPVDARTDVYGLGCVAYRCMTGTTPFVRDDEAAVLWAHLVERPPLMSTHRPELAPWDVVVARALEKDPAERFAACGEFMNALAAVKPSSTGDDPALSASQRPAREEDDMTQIRHGLGIPPSSAAGLSAAPHVPVAPRPDQESEELVPPADTNARRRSTKTSGRSKGLLVAVVVAVLAVLASGVFVFTRNNSESNNPAPDPTLQAAAVRICRSALSAADSALSSGAEVATQIRRHAGVMTGANSNNKAIGRPALTAGAAAATQHEFHVNEYRSLATECTAASASPNACKARLGSADNAIKIAGTMVTALREHTAVMDRWDAGELTADEAHHMGKPAQDRGLAAATAFDRAIKSYRDASGTC